MTCSAWEANRAGPVRRGGGRPAFCSGFAGHPIPWMGCSTGLYDLNHGVAIWKPFLLHKLAEPIRSYDARVFNQVSVARNEPYREMAKVLHNMIQGCLLQQSLS